MSSRFAPNIVIGPLVCAFLLSTGIGIGSAQEDSSDLAEVLKGFDDDKEAVDDDDVLSGFDDESDAAAEDTEERGDSFWEFTGSVSLGPSLNYAHDKPGADEADYRGLTRLRHKLWLDLDLRLSESWKALISGNVFHDFAYLLKGRDEFTDEVLDAYERDVELQEVYVQGSLLNKLDLKFGRQIVNWSKSDNIRVLDVLNSVDLREPGMVDIEDLRLPVTMTRLDYSFKNWSLTGIAIHEIRFNKEPVFGSEFFPLDTPPPREQIPKEGGKNTEYAAALNGIGILTGVDASLYFARFFDDTVHIEQENDEFELRHSRLTMTGTSAFIARGNWLLKTEMGYFDGLEFLASSEKKSRFDALFGFEYSGSANATISVDVVNRQLIDFESAMGELPDSALKNDFQYILTYRGDLHRETVHLIALASVLGATGGNGALERLSVTYDWTDDLCVTAGAVLYQSGDTLFFQEAADNDRFFYEVKYSF